MSHDLLELEGVTKNFGGLKAVDHVTLSLAQGEVLALVGPNGSGKTTLLNLISGAFSADGGRILFEGQRIERLPAHRIFRAGIARTFQLVRIFEQMGVVDNVAVAAMQGPARLSPAPARKAAEAMLDRIGFAADRAGAAGALNYMDQKRLELARALVAGPKLLLLDEWLAGLNPTELRDGIAAVRAVAATGTAVILVEHVMSAVHALARRCVVMQGGAVIADAPPAEAFANPAVVAAYIGVGDAAA